MRLLKALSIVLVVLLASGCDEKRGLVGEWKFDGPYTKSQLEEDQPPFADAIVAAFKGGTLVFREDKVLYVGGDGRGSGSSYDLVDKPTPDSWRILMEDGKVETWFREGKRLRVSSFQGVEANLYFERNSK